MVTNVTSLTGNGLKDWLIQRATAIYFALYLLFLFGFIFMHPQMKYSQWHALFQSPWFKIATVIALLTFFLHTWVGIWTVMTDYLKSKPIRMLLEFLVFLFLLGQFVWGLMILWGHA